MKIFPFFLFCLTASAEIITSDRLYPWQGNVGIPGGIPNVTTIWTNLPAGASPAVLQAHVGACPSNQVLKLGAGTFNYGTPGASQNLTISGDGAVIRGTLVDGVPATKIVFQNSCLFLKFRKSVSQTALDTSAALSVDAVKGGTTLTLASVPSWVTVGELIGIDQLNDSDFVNDEGEAGNADSLREIEGNGERSKGMVNRVTAKTATTITLEMPLDYGYEVAQTAQIFQPLYNPSTQTSLKRAGLEDIILEFAYNGSPDCHVISMENADNCWIKNVHSTNQSGGVAVWGVYSYRCEVRESSFRDSVELGGGEGYGVGLYHNTTGWLVEDNVFELLHNSMTVNKGATANVFAYNASFNNQSDSGQHPGGGNSHTSHPTFNLFEGNFAEDKLLFDFTAGSASHATVFRNRITGENGSGDSRTCVSIEIWQRYMNVVGNILGTPSLQNKLYQHSGSTAIGSQGSIFKLGGEININNDFTPSDAFSYTSGMFILLHGNADTITSTNSGVVWNGSPGQNIADQTLPDSYYTTRPSFWPSTWPWPRIIPGTTSMATAQATVETLNPAAWRFYNPGVAYPDLGYGGGGGSSGASDVNVTELRVGTIQVAP